jgi:hypothetical protein
MLGLAVRQRGRSRASRRDASVPLLPVHPGRSERDRVRGVADDGLEARDPLEHIRDIGFRFHALTRFMVGLGNRAFENVVK